MASYLHSRHRKAGLPEFLLVCALVLAVVPLTIVWIDFNQPEWPGTGGWVMSGDIVTTHYNAPDYKEKVTVHYEYLVGGGSYKGEFVGLWPEVGSPNALPVTELDRLKNKGYPLVVFYNPAKPSQSRLHTRSQGDPILLVLIAGICVVTAGLYAFVFYPAWRRQR